MAPTSSRAPLVLFVTVVVAVAVYLVGLSLFGGSQLPQASQPIREERIEPVVEPVLEVAPATAMSAIDYTVDLAQITTISAKNLPVGRPVTLGLTLPEPAPLATQLTAKIVDESNRELDAQALVVGRSPTGEGAEEGGTARLEIEEGWLTPGTYLIYLKTTEKSHFPLRRYPIEVH